MRKIIHIDMDAFFASVEQRDFPEYRGKPLIVGGQPDSRGVVAACSYEARKFGIHSAMPTSKAYKLCPEAIFVKPRFEAYKESSQQIQAIFKLYTPHVEPLSLDEAYLDVTEVGLFKGSATKIAQAIREEIQQELNLTASAGVSYNKFLAKIASDMDKPNGIYVIRPEQALAFIDSLAIGKFFGIGKVTEAKMNALNIYTGADLKQFEEVQLQTHFGKSGRYYYNIARGIDERPVKSSRKRKSIGKETTFSQDKTDKKEIWITLQKIALRLEDILNKKGMRARTLTLKIKYHNFTQVTRSKTPSQPFNEKSGVAQAILSELPELLKKTETGTRPIRLIGITLSNLQASDNICSEQHASSANNTTQQLGLFNEWV